MIGHNFGGTGSLSDGLPTPETCQHQFVWQGTDTGGNDLIMCGRCGYRTTVIDCPPRTGRLPTALVPKSEPNLQPSTVFENPAANCAAAINPNYVTVQLGGLPKSSDQ